MESPLKYSVIVLTAAATVGVGLLGVKLYSTLNQANLLQVDAPQIENSSLSGEARLSKGDGFFKNKDFSSAATEYQIATELDPENPTAHLKLGTTLQMMHDYAAAEESLQTAYTLRPDAETAAAYAHLLILQEKNTDAEQVLSSVSDSSQALLYEKALYNILQNHNDTAKSQLEEAQKTSGVLPTELFENYLNSFSTFEASQGAENTYLQALLCKSLIDAEQFEIASFLAHTVLKAKNDYRDVWMLLGYAEFKLEKYDDAEAAFKQAKHIDSVKPEVHYFLGSILVLKEDYNEAVDELELALLYGFSPAEEAYKKIAEAHEATSSWNDAVIAYEALLNLNPSNAYAFERPVVLCLEKLNDPNRALSIAQKAATQFPSQAMAHTLLAKVYLAQGQLELADSSVNAAFDADSNFVLAHFTAGQIREAQNNQEGAKWEYKKVFELTAETDPLHTQAAEKYNALLSTSPTL